MLVYKWNYIITSLSYIQQKNCWPKTLADHRVRAFSFRDKSYLGSLIGCKFLAICHGSQYLIDVKRFYFVKEMKLIRKSDTTNFLRHRHKIIKYNLLNSYDAWPVVARTSPVVLLFSYYFFSINIILYRS